MTPKINILICDDHAILLEGLKVCLLHMPEVDKVAVSSTLKMPRNCSNRSNTSTCALSTSTFLTVLVLT